MRVRLFNMAQQEIFEKEQDKAIEIESLKDLLDKNYDKIENLSLGNITPGIPISFYDFDAMTQGLRRGDLIAFAGRPMMGKTSLALQIAKNIGSQNLPVCFFGFDMSKEEYVYRILAMNLGIEINRLRSGRLQQDEWALLGEEIYSLGQLPIFIEDKRRITIKEIKAKCENIVSKSDQKNLGLIVIDSYHMIEYPNLNDYQAQLERNTRDLKDLAKELNVPVLITAPISKSLEFRENKRPMLSDIRDCGDALEYYGDIIVMLYRDEYYDPETEDRGIADLIVTKHRNGPVGTVKMLFEPQYGRYRNLVHEL